MSYESCHKKYSHYFSPELKNIFRFGNKQIPWILELLDENCDNIDCSHHVMNVAREFGSNNREPVVPVDAPWVLQCHRCMCLLDLIDNHNLTLQEIGDIFGMSKQGVQWYENMALSKLRGMFRNQEEFEEKGG